MSGKGTRVQKSRRRGSKGRFVTGPCATCGTDETCRWTRSAIDGKRLCNSCKIKENKDTTTPRTYAENKRICKACKQVPKVEGYRGCCDGLYCKQWTLHNNHSLQKYRINGIPFEDFVYHHKSGCFYCLGPCQSIDRGDNSRAYYEDGDSSNSVGCCLQCNTAKSSQDYFQWVNGMGDKFVIQGEKQLEQYSELYAYLADRAPDIDKSDTFKNTLDEYKVLQDRLEDLMVQVLDIRSKAQSQLRDIITDYKEREGPVDDIPRGMITGLVLKDILSLKERKSIRDRSNRHTK